MTGKARWSVHPHGRVRLVSGPTPPAPQSSAPRPVGIGAVCDLIGHAPGSPDYQDFSVCEFLDLEGGERLTLRDGLGFTIGSPRGDVHEGLCAGDVLAAVLTVVLPDDAASEEDHPWTDLAMLARRRRVRTCADELAGLNYEVYLTAAVQRWL